MRHAKVSAVAIAVAAVLAGPQALAQTAPPRAGERAANLGEVVVTSSRREERIVDVPYAITAVGGPEIEERGAFDLKQLQYSVPGLAMNTSQVIGADRIQLRGVDAGAGTGLPTVGVYVDDVGISVDQQQRDSGFPLVDIERVEVLRGPQGTLYGQGSVSGTIRYITRDPSLTKFEGFADATLSSVADGGTGYRINGAFGGPIVEDTFGVRVVAGYDKSAGWIDYSRLGQKDFNEVETQFARIKAVYAPEGALRASLLYQYLDSEADANNTSDVGTSLVSSEERADPASDGSHILNLTVDYDFGAVKLTSATGWVDRDFLFVASGRNLGLPAGLNAGLSFDINFKQFSQELRLASSGDGRLRWVVGAWYRDFESPAVRQGLPAPAVPIFAGLFRVGTDPVNSESRALFGDVTWAFTDSLEASVGLRYYEDERETIGTNAAGVTTSASAEFDSTSPRFNVLYKWSDAVSSYATVAKGFRSGGFNFDRSTFDPETLWSYEIGTKAALLEGRLYLDAAAYYLDYENRQSNNRVGPFAVTTNAGAASGPGAEFALSMRLPSELSLNLTGSWNDVAFDSTTFENNEGEPFNYVPEFTASASLSQKIPFGAGGLAFTWR
ncbi:MAG: TonB-dependent receptor, partial [Pseudomonadota bacterium]